ncbi:MAG: low-specificity L-threonine aldolase [Anaerolineae bacterium]|nr:low-specificity L-threonine aldolase [Anaerolineae bacterium]
MNTIDLRSDTVSHPTPAMRKAMAEAVVGDDVFGDDPTVLELQAYAADLLGKEDALFVSSGTQGNLVACLTHCGRGDELIVGKQAHIFQYEQGGSSVLGGIVMSQVPVQPNGELKLDDIKASLRTPNEDHHPITKLICLENTQGGVGGVPITAEYTATIGEFAHAHGYKLHIDGARLFNAAAALNVEARELVKHADSVSICLSKGLIAPIGSLLVGSKDFIRQARRNRKLLGGGMRQVGILAAAGLISLKEMRLRLAEDHATAQQLADGLAEIPGITVHPIHQRTNMLYFSIPETLDAADFVAAMKAQNIILRGGPHFRAVTHYWIKPEHIQIMLNAVYEYMKQHAGEFTSAANVMTKNAY